MNVEELKKIFLKTRVPVGFVAYFLGLYLVRNYTIIVHIILACIMWWELAKEFPQNKLLIQGITTGFSLLDIYLFNFQPGAPILMIGLVRTVIVFVLIVVLKIEFVDAIVLNYLLWGITFILKLFADYPFQVFFNILMAIAGSDTIQYFGGKMFGKTKIVPKISPNKSLEGYIIAVVACNLIAVFWIPDGSGIDGMYLLFVNGMLYSGIFGDLFISWWKRSHGVKDTSNLLGKHGGFLDRLDSHIAAWYWSLPWGIMYAYPAGSDFTRMNPEQIDYLIYTTWAVVWVRFFYGVSTGNYI